MDDTRPAPRADPDAPAFPPTRAAGLDRLAAFVDRAGHHYARGRNHDLPGHPHVSGLSPYLRHRAVTEAEVARAVVDRHGREGAEKFLWELFWRTYFKGWLERRPVIWDGHRRALARARDRLATEAGLCRAWEDACEGRTGIEPFDHWAREVAATGYLHNHARMWFASIWMHTLRLPLALGADFFLRHLLDGDPASNTLSWRWVAGLHTEGKVYRARARNIAQHTGGRFDPEVLGHRLAREDQMPDAAFRPHPPPAPVPADMAWEDGCRTGLLLHDDDLDPGDLLARGLRPVSAAVLSATEGRSPFRVSGNVARFARALAADAARRCGDRCFATAPTGDLDALVGWARENRLEQVVAPYAPAGPVCAALDRLEERLHVPLVRPLRRWDAAAWPWCTAGYHKLRARIPQILDAALAG